MSYLVFVSHSSTDTWVARQLASHIESITGSEVFLDAVEMQAGDDYDMRIRRAITECEEMVVLMTPKASESRNVWMEIGAVWGRGKRIVGILYGLTADDIGSDLRMPIGLRRVQLVDINDTDMYLAEVAGRIRNEASV